MGPLREGLQGVEAAFQHNNIEKVADPYTEGQSQTGIEPAFYAGLHDGKEKWPDHKAKRQAEESTFCQK